MVKQSSNDKHLLPLLAKYLEHVDPLFSSKKSRLQKEKLTAFDAVIATGSNNTARYFEYYFKNKPNIIRKSRNSVAVLTGKESDSDLEKLSDDVFQVLWISDVEVYPKCMFPKAYNFDAFFNGMYNKKEIISTMPNTPTTTTITKPCT